MSRVGKAPIKLPKGAKISVAAGVLSVEGPLGKLSQPVHPLVKVNVEDDVLTFAPADESREANALQGTMRALANNMVNGVTTGFQRKLNLVGVGYRAQLQGNALKLQLGFSHDVIHEMPEGVKAETPTQTEIIIKGADKQKVGQVAAEVRAYRPPEPYKGKGVRYSDERVILKETKKK
ncbi:50S ribosomal protein L6 [Cupriavidus respiraculi]|uniref:Large ribosomal subunit protein uL6 n=1 Tax=Cupriavidus respiraculi TaxID=195930 RepID=A0ABN7ZEB7_9BURK|nr:50S ribosomal protein L6 [Cupriavidus respiraculi]MBY4949991.1 50S ribosomal protein L6 [Cupriavidus respiraculi]CAG9182662.1 50S ribosomal protein L6 [Cupriavidus respiraculi]